MMETKDEPQLPIPNSGAVLEIKNKKPNKKSKKSTSSENSQDQVKVPTPEDNISTKTDTGLTGTAKKNAAKKKKQREKKAAAALTAQNEQGLVTPVVSQADESNDTEKTNKPKDKKKKTKPAVNEEKVLNKFHIGSCFFFVFY